MEETSEFPRDLFHSMAELDFMKILIPPEYGGVGQGQLERMILLEEIGRHSTAMALSLIAHQNCVLAIRDLGTEEQKKSFLPDFATGDKLGTFSATEPAGGSDLMGIQTTASPSDGGYLINGRKCYNSNSHVSAVFIILVRTAEGAKGLSNLIVEAGSQGFHLGRKENLMGIYGSMLGELIFKDCRVPKANLLGQEGSGLKNAIYIISRSGRNGMAAAALGLIKGSLEEAVKFSNKRVLFGKPISKLQGIQWHIADIYADYEITKTLTYRAAWMNDQGLDCDAEIALAKYHGCEAAIRCAKNAIAVLGTYGLTKECPVQRFLRDALCCVPSDGTSEIMKIVMARKALG
jgi:butyryl-CoA dehydrogenase